MPFFQEAAADIAGNSKTLIAGGSGLLILGGTAVKYMANAGQNERLIKVHRSKSTYQEDSRRKKTVEVHSQNGEVVKKMRVPKHTEGEMYGIIKRGWRVGFPFIRSYRKVSLKQNNGRTEDFHVMRQIESTEQPKKTRAFAKVNFAIVDEPYAMNCATYDFDSPGEHKQTVMSICTSGLRKITKNMPDWALDDNNILLAGLEAVASSQLLTETGVGLRGVQLNEFIISDSEVLVRNNDGIQPAPSPAALQEVGQTDLQLDTSHGLHIA